MKRIPATLLLPVYFKDQAQYLTECLNSINEQTYLPDEIYILIDGQIPDELKNAINSSYSNIKPIIYQSEENIGLPEILNIGLSLASYDYVFRMDADDICVENRFELQWEFLICNPSIDILGGQIIEFNSTFHKNKTRAVPTTHNQILEVIRTRNPFNHMTIVYKKKSVLKVGGYRNLKGFEDYDLWGRMISAGALVHNLESILVRARTTSDFLKRRSGLKYAFSEINFFFSAFHWQKSYRPKWGVFGARILSRLLPLVIIQFIYKFARE